MYTLHDLLLLLSINSNMSENTSSESGGSSSASPSIPSPVAINNSRINFKDLKKEIKGIEKLNKDNLDIKSLASELKL